MPVSESSSQGMDKEIKTRSYSYGRKETGFT